MRTLLTIVLVVYSLFTSAQQYAEIGMPVARVFDIEEHLGGRQNWDLMQAQNGLIYNGMSSGISEWDGEKWRRYHTLDNSRVRAIHQWHDDKLYIGTVNDIGYFAPDSNGNLGFTSLLVNWSFEQRQQIGEVWRIAATGQAIAFVSDRSIYIWDGEQVHLVVEEHGSVFGLRDIAAYDDGFIFKKPDDSAIYKIALTQLGGRPTVSKTDISLPADATVSKFMISPRNELIIMTYQHGFYTYDGLSVEQIIPPKAFDQGAVLYDAVLARDGYYYAVSLNHGLYIITPNYNVVKRYRAQDKLQIDAFYTVMEDQQGNIWFGGRVKLGYFTPPHIVSTYSTQTQSAGTENIGLLRNIPTLASEGLLVLNTYPNNDLLAPATFSNIKPDKRFVWHFIEYKEHILYTEDGGIYALPISSDQSLFIHQDNPDAVIQALRANSGRMLAICPLTNRLYATTYEGLFHLWLDNGQWQSRLIENTVDQLDRIAIDKNGVIWAGTATQELYRIEYAQREDIPNKVNKFSVEAGLPRNNVLPFLLNQGIVFGTDDGWKTYQANNSLAFVHNSDLPVRFNATENSLYRLYEDLKNRVWYVLSDGAGYLSKKNGLYEDNSDFFRRFPAYSFVGFTQNDPEAIWMSRGIGVPYRANINTMAEAPTLGQLNFRKVTNINTNETLFGGSGDPTFAELNQQNSSLRIDFALSDSSIEGATRYRYRLLGSRNKEWSQWTDETQKDFTDLRGSQYEFELQARDGWGRVVSERLIFSVLPPWYASATAITAYVLMGIVLLILSGYATQRVRTKRLKEQNLKLECTVAKRTKEVRVQAEELKQQQVLKDRFFVNVSHEFRTPLTLTIAPLEDLIRNQPLLKDDIALPVTTALRNAQQMMALVGQVLDINRLEAGRFEIQVSEYDIAETVNQVVERFEQWAAQHGQTLVVQNTENPIMLYFDRDQIDRCLSNLLSNAIKYSGQNTLVHVSVLNDENDYISIVVADNGVGVSEQSKLKVFERYYQGEHSESVSNAGTGVGLALVKELVELHKGRITLANTQGGGCTFTLQLKRGQAHIEQGQIAPISEESTSNSKASSSQPKPQALTEKYISQHQQSTPLSSSDSTTILVVDDNAELRQFIAQKLEGYYRVLQADNGEVGLEMAKTELPDLIVTDVMMPVMDGKAMTQALRLEPSTKTLPIIMLSAKSTKRQTVEGLTSGADDYLSKPFDTSELIARIRGLINNRKQLRLSLLSTLASANSSTKTSLCFDEKVSVVVANNLSDPEFNIDALASAMAVSRASLNRKCRRSFNKSALQIINDMRMEKAQALLKQRKHAVSDIAYGVGFESLSYFSRSFKKHFGTSPSSFEQ